MSRSILTTEGVTVRFGGLTAVDGINVDVIEGTIHGVIGPNGAGKTTFFDAVSGHRAVTAGRIGFMGRDVTSEPAHSRARMGMARTFQLGGLVPDLTALENVVLGLDQSRRAGTKRVGQLKALAADVLDRLNVGTHAVALAGSLPVGTRRIVEVARAIAADAHLVLLDEPGAGLEESESRELVEVIRSLAADGTSFLLTDHSMDLVFAACDDVTVMNFGEPIAHGAPDEVRRDPKVLEAYLGTREMENA